MREHQVEHFAAVIEALKTGGPYALVALIGWAYIKERANNKELYLKVIEITQQMTASNVELKAAMTALKDAMNSLAIRLPTGRSS